MGSCHRVRNERVRIRFRSTLQTPGVIVANRRERPADSIPRTASRSLMAFSFTSSHWYASSGMYKLAEKRGHLNLSCSNITKNVKNRKASLFEMGN